MLLFQFIYLFPLFYSVTDPDTRLQALWVVCDKLPKNNKTNLRLVKKKKKKEGRDAQRSLSTCAQ